MMLCVSCNSVDKYAKNDLLGVKKIEEGLYWETYCVYRGGVYAGNIYTRYLTDSISFRLYLGLFDDHEQISVVPIGNHTVLVRKYNINTHATIEQKEYNLYTLKQKGKFD